MPLPPRKVRPPEGADRRPRGSGGAMFSARRGAESGLIAKHLPLATEDPDAGPHQENLPQESETSHGMDRPGGTGADDGNLSLQPLRAVPDGSQRVLRCCWGPDAAEDIGAGVASWWTASAGSREGSEERRSREDAKFFSKERLMIIAVTGVWLAAGLAMFTSGEVVRDKEGRSLSIVQALYLISQIVTTTGYGDITPKSDLGMLCSTVYILFSALMFSGIIMEVTDAVVDHQQSQFDNALLKVLDQNDDIHGAVASQSFVQRYSGLIMAAMFYFAVAFSWTLFFMFYCDTEADVCEGLDAIEGFYFAIVSICGIGFGDITPRTSGGKIFSSIFGVIGVVTYVNLVGAISDTMLKAKKSSHLAWMTEHELNVADRSQDGKVDLYEFTRYILTHFNLVSGDVFDDIKINFEELDVDNSGELTSADLKALFSQGDAQRRRA
mmetsp:Transcript_99954/g.320595  ORF Transcript_99954/g.320595 Transcript_99954/m.320595 type:complete len:439 (+) Transcript_99954:58-1374(+)